MIAKCKPLARVGFTVVEVAAAAAILAAVFVFVAQAALWTAANRSAIDRRQSALVEAENVMEQLTSLPWAELTAETAAKVTLSPSAAERFGNQALTSTVTSSEDQPGAKRIVVQVRYSDGDQVDARRVRLVAWAYRQGAQ